ncbi:hypothetical protein Syun_011487 [Stephania yunnanensis]|uniref:Cation-transporting P-type ATPase N-terminal domain-containing protein n=1 Tax=Stephania yunnanensis TaxID=152371 RepID=A0AAP0PFH6_9MAGN
MDEKKSIALEAVGREVVNMENIPIEGVFENLKCTREGLRSNEVKECLQLFGYNKLEEKKSSQRLRDHEMLMDSEERRIIIFSSKTCGDVGLEIGNAIRVHHLWKDISGNYTMRSFYHEVVKLQVLLWFLFIFSIALVIFRRCCTKFEQGLCLENGTITGGLNVLGSRPIYIYEFRDGIEMDLNSETELTTEFRDSVAIPSLIFEE